MGSIEGRHDHAPAVDVLACVGCGLCEAQCPTRAISGVGSAAELIVAAAAGKQTLRLRCEAARTSGGKLEANRQGAAGLDVGCLARLHPETVAAAAGALDEDGAVELMRGDCDKCPVGASDAVRRMVSQAGACLAGARRIHLGVVLESEDPAEATQKPTSRMSRRALFRKASPRRMAEDAVADGTSSIGGKAPRVLVLQNLLHPALPRPRVKSGCTGCGACINVCPQDALTFSDVNDVFALTVDPTCCVQCDECVRVCPEKVMHPSLRLPDPSLELLTQVHMHRCEICGMRLSPREAGRCAACTSRQSLVSDIWSQYGL